MKGFTYKRCPCPVQRDKRGRRLACKKPHGSWYYVVDAAPTGAKRQQITKGGFPSQEAADLAVAQVIAGGGIVPVPVAQTPGSALDGGTVNEYLDEWLELIRDGMADTGWTNYRAVLDAYVRPHIGAMGLTDVNALTLSRLYATLRKTGKKVSARDAEGKIVRDAEGKRVTVGAPLAKSSVALVHRILHKAFADAVVYGKVESNPADVPNKPSPGSRHETTVWDAEQAVAFLAHVRETRLYAAWLLALTCGLRRGELAGLRWSDVDLDGRTARLHTQRTVDVDGREVEKEPKGTSKRTIDIGEAVCEALRAHKTQTTAERLAYGEGYVNSGRVFVKEDGTAYRPPYLRVLFQRLARRAGVPVIRLHDARHSCATLGLDAGIHPKVMQQLLGHSSVRITMDTYTHRVARLQRDATARIEGVLLGTG